MATPAGLSQCPVKGDDIRDHQHGSADDIASSQCSQVSMSQSLDTACGNVANMFCSPRTTGTTDATELPYAAKAAGYVAVRHRAARFLKSPAKTVCPLHPGVRVDVSVIIMLLNVHNVS